MEQEVWYYLSIYAMGALGGLTRVSYNGDRRSIGHAMAVAGVGGGTGFGLAAMLISLNYFPAVLPVGWLGFAMIIGLSGKNSIDLIEWLSDKAKKRFEDKEQ